MGLLRHRRALLTVLVTASAAFAACSLQATGSGDATSVEDAGPDTSVAEAGGDAGADVVAVDDAAGGEDAQLPDASPDAELDAARDADADAGDLDAGAPVNDACAPPNYRCNMGCFTGCGLCLGKPVKCDARRECIANATPCP